MLSSPHSASPSALTNEAETSPTLLIGKVRQLDLKHAFLGLCASAKYFEDQPGAVDDLGFPGALKIALLHWSELVVDND